MVTLPPGVGPDVLTFRSESAPEPSRGSCRSFRRGSRHPCSADRATRPSPPRARTCTRRTRPPERAESRSGTTSGSSSRRSAPSPSRGRATGRPVSQGAGAQRPTSGWVQVGPVRREDVVRPCRIRERLRYEGNIGRRAAADHRVAVRRHSDAGVRLTSELERGHVEVGDGLVADPPIGAIPNSESGR